MVSRAVFRNKTLLLLLLRWGTAGVGQDTGNTVKRSTKEKEHQTAREIAADGHRQDRGGTGVGQGSHMKNGAVSQRK